MSLNQIAAEVHACTRCPRLRKYCEGVAKTKKRVHLDETYWGKPISGFGDPKAQIVIVGLAPAAHGANRTGRIFTGDRSGLWLYRALHKAGFANQPTYEHAGDGLKLNHIYITCAVKCAPPGNKPLPIEIKKCGSFLERELLELKTAKIYLVLGQIGLNTLWPLLKETSVKKPKLKHGELVELSGGRAILMSFHPSQQNTFTGRLTEPMFDQVFKTARKYLNRN
jgi:uracil-DNA glycosylase family 4